MPKRGAGQVPDQRKMLRSLKVKAISVLDLPEASASNWTQTIGDREGDSEDEASAAMRPLRAAAAQEEPLKSKMLVTLRPTWLSRRG